MLTPLLGVQLVAASAQAAPPRLSIDPARRVTSGPICKPGERIAFWFAVATGGVGSFTTANSTGEVYAQGDGTIAVTIGALPIGLCPRTRSASSPTAAAATSVSPTSCRRNERAVDSSPNAEMGRPRRQRDTGGGAFPHDEAVTRICLPANARYQMEMYAQTLRNG